jgi:hypothetical protein
MPIVITHPSNTTSNTIFLTQFFFKSVQTYIMADLREQRI